MAVALISLVGSDLLIGAGQEVVTARPTVAR
jgi:hypothetical protein